MFRKNCISLRTKIHTRVTHRIITYCLIITYTSKDKSVKSTLGSSAHLYEPLAVGCLYTLYYIYRLASGDEAHS